LSVKKLRKLRLSVLDVLNNIMIEKALKMDEGMVFGLSKIINIRPIIAVVKYPDSYYDFTTFHVINLPRFTAFCSSCDKFNSLGEKFIVGKLRQIGAVHGILGGNFIMIKNFSSAKAGGEHKP